MKAVRVSKRAKEGFYTVHWLSDEEETCCRLPVDGLNIVADLDLETLPELEGCRNCRRVVDGWEKPARHVAEDVRVYRDPSPGRLRKTGSLSHGTRVVRGSRLW